MIKIVEGARESDLFYNICLLHQESSFDEKELLKIVPSQNGEGYDCWTSQKG